MFEVSVSIGDLARGDLTPVSAMVDTGSIHSVMPASLLARVGVAPLEFRSYTVADGREVNCGFGSARFRIDGRELICPVIFGEEDQYLLGATSLEIFEVMVDPIDGTLVPKPQRPPRPF